MIFSRFRPVSHHNLKEAYVIPGIFLLSFQDTEAENSDNHLTTFFMFLMRFMGFFGHFLRLLKWHEKTRKRFIFNACGMYARQDSNL